MFRAFRFKPFKKTPRANKPERICSKSAEDHAIKVGLQQSEGKNFEEIDNTARRIVRSELEKINKWKFSRSFSVFTTSTQLSTLIQWVFCGPKCATKDMPKKFH